jgi:DNA-binding CsgD family transcriptional regulator
VADDRDAVHLSTLVGRAHECALIDELLMGARAGESGSLVIRGEPGIGKTALLEYAAAGAGGMQVLTTVGIEAEADLAFAGLYGLLRPILGHLGGVPRLQAEALSGALGLTPSTGSERFLVAAAVLGLLAEAADKQPVLCLIDDAHWLDTPSSEALVFAARRFRAERVAMLFAARVGDPRAFESPGLLELDLVGLDNEAALTLLSDRSEPIASSVRQGLLRESSGNPLALLELPTALSAEQRAGREQLPDPIPLTSRVQAAFAARIERLPRPTQALLLVAALDDAGDAATLLRAGDRLGVTTDALEPAETAGLVRPTAHGLEFRHPLVRAAVIGSATLAQRQRTHAALAAALGGDEHADRRVWHRALATLTPDENVAAALDAAARRSQLRGGHSSAASAFERAAELSDTEPSRGRRLCLAAEAAWEAGQVDRARSLVGRSLPRANGAARVRLLALSGAIDGRSGRLPDAVSILVSGIEASDDHSLSLHMLREACEFAVYAADFGQAAALSEKAALLQPVSDEDHFIVAAFSAVAAELSGDYARAAALSTEAIERAKQLEDPRCLITAAIAAGRVGIWGDGLQHASRAVSIARERAQLTILPYALQAQASQLLARSEFDRCYAAAAEGRQLALDIGQPWAAGWNLVNLATVSVVRGHEEEALAHAEELQAFVSRSGANLLRGQIGRALGLLDLTLGRPHEALERLHGALGAAAPVAFGTGPLVVLGPLDAAEAAARSNRLGEIAGYVHAYAEWVDRCPHPGRVALLARLRAILDEPGAEQHFVRALELGSALSPFELGRTELLYGEWLRRQRRRVDARPHLRAALELFEQLAVGPWEERARAELRASGETIRRRELSTLEELTPQELQIARLVAEGMTNREIAAQLILSPRTIDYHLRKVFTKLRITSRSDLAHMRLAEHASR